MFSDKTGRSHALEDMPVRLPLSLLLIYISLFNNHKLVINTMAA